MLHLKLRKGDYVKIGRHLRIVFEGFELDGARLLYEGSEPNPMSITGVLMFGRSFAIDLRGDTGQVRLIGHPIPYVADPPRVILFSNGRRGNEFMLAIDAPREIPLVMHRHGDES